MTQEGQMFPISKCVCVWERERQNPKIFRSVSLKSTPDKIPLVNHK